MSGWSQVHQASHRPSGDGLGAATNAPSSTSTTRTPDPSVGTATTRWVAEVPDTRSSTDTSQRPSAVVRPSAWRTSGPPVVVSRTGRPDGPGSNRYHSWSSWST